MREGGHALLVRVLRDRVEERLAVFALGEGRAGRRLREGDRVDAGEHVRVHVGLLQDAAGARGVRRQEPAGLPAELLGLLQRRDHERGDRHRVEEHVGAGRGQLGELRVDRCVGRLVGEGLDDLDVVGALDRLHEALDVAVAVVVVLAQDRDLVVFARRGEQLAERAALLLVDRHETDLLGALGAVAEDRVAGHDEHLRNALVDRRLAPRSVGRRAEADAGGEDAVRDHLLEVREGLLRVVRVVVGLDLDRAGLAVAELDAALGVLDAEVGERPVDGAVARSGGGAGQRARDAEREARVGDARAGLGRSFGGVSAAVTGVSAAGAPGDEHGDDADARDDRGDAQPLAQCAHVSCLFSCDCVGGMGSGAEVPGPAGAVGAMVAVAACAAPAPPAGIPRSFVLASSPEPRQRDEAAGQHEQDHQEDDALQHRGEARVDGVRQLRREHVVRAAEQRAEDAAGAADHHRGQERDRVTEAHRLGRGVLHDDHVEEAADSADERGDREREHLVAVRRDAHRRRDGLVALDDREGPAVLAADEVAGQQEHDARDRDHDVQLPLVVVEPGPFGRGRESGRGSLRSAGELRQPLGEGHADDAAARS